MPSHLAIDRRRFLGTSALATLSASGLYQNLLAAVEQNGAAVVAPLPTHFTPKARHVIVVFLTGGYSQVDTFDPKPRLTRDQGQKLGAGFALASPFQFAQCGESGLWLSDLFPELRTVADDLAVVRSLHTDILEHFQATLAMHTGSATVPMPSLGAWLSYGLGTLNANLPSFLVLAEHLPYAGAQVWDSNFLPPAHQGVRIIPGTEPIPDLRSATRHVTLAELEHQMLRDLNAAHAANRPNDLELQARITSHELARGMQAAAPEAFDLNRETQSVRELYGLAADDYRSFAAQCLTARRLVERGVRCVTLIDTGSHDNWDAHGDMDQHRGKAQRVDRAIAGLIRDLKQRGLFDQTLIVGCTEFGRTPWASSPTAKGREHHAQAFSCFLTGAGVRGGTTYGVTDDYGVAVVDQSVHVHDFHATILHLLGLDHTRLTYRYAGRDFRLTDVSGEVIQPLLS